MRLNDDDVKVGLLGYNAVRILHRYQRFRGTYCLHLQSKGGGNMFVQNSSIHKILQQ
jgi:hypothetical protein